MDIPSIKNLKKLAAACRKAGILNFKYNKDESFEFSLDPSYQEPQKQVKASSQPQATTINPNTFETDTLTEEQLMFWSAPNDPESEELQGPAQ